MNVSELVELLKTEDQSKTVYVVSLVYNRGGSSHKVVMFDPSKHLETTEDDLLLGRWEEVENLDNYK